MKIKLLWASALALVLVLGALLVNTEGRYLQFVVSLGDIDTKIVWIKTDAGPEMTLLTFNVVFHNTSKLPMWVEAINTQMYLGGEFAGAPSITEGSYEVPPEGESSIPLTAALWAARRQLLEQTKAHGGDLHLEGRARVRIGADKTDLRTFYPVSGTFSVPQDHGS
jgi:hypothetical protein